MIYSSGLRRCYLLAALAATMSLPLPVGALAGQAGGIVEPVKPCFVAPSKGIKVEVKYDCGYVVVSENPSEQRSQG